MIGPRLEVCFSPALLHAVRQDPDRNVVVVDILRATTAMCTAFGFGVNSIIPVSDLEIAMTRKQEGWLVAGERDGEKLAFADFGNSPVEFRKNSLAGKDIVYSTTNGTCAILDGKRFGRVHIASFVNLDTVCGHLNREKKDVLIICAGWKDSFSLEDSIFAGAMADLLINAYGFLPEGDSVLASMTLWGHAVRSLQKTISRSDHYLRLLGIENRKTLKYCIFPEKFPVVPVLEGERLVDLGL